MPSTFSIRELTRLFQAIPARQRFMIAAAAVAVAAAVLVFPRWQRERDLRPLFTSMSAEDAGAMVAKLKEQVAEYRLSDNGRTISVPSAHVDELRLAMAAAGLPKTGRVGYELFDKTNFGATDFTEQVNYRRALEGELERSIRALNNVEQARVHLTFAKDSVFLDSRQPAKASVVLSLRPGAFVSGQNVSAVRYLVSSAVEGLSPEAVSVVDSAGAVLGRPRKPATDGRDISDEALEYRERIEKDLLAKVNGTLEPLLGAGRFQATVSVDCDLTSGEQSEEIFDPEHSVMSTSQKTEDTSASSGRGGVPGTASTLPRPAPPANAAGGGSSRKTENVTYQSSRKVVHRRLPEGTVKRMSISVLVDQDVHWTGHGRTAKQVLTPPSAEQLKTIHEVVGAAVGLSSERGDQLIVDTLPFESTRKSEPPSDTTERTPPLSPFLPPWAANPITLIAGGLAFALLGTGALFYMRRRKAKTAPSAVVRELGTGAAEAGSEPLLGSAASASATEHLLSEAQARLLPESPGAQVQNLIAQVKSSVDKDPAFAANLLRSWIKQEPA